MSEEPYDTPRSGLTTQIWVDTFWDLSRTGKTEAERDVAEMAANILDLAIESDLLIQYLNEKTEEAMVWRERYRNGR